MRKHPISKTVAGLTVPFARHPEVRRLKRNGHNPNIHGTKLWGSGHLLIDFIASNSSLAPTSVIDAGCGWGLAGIWCAKTFGAAVASVDADSCVMPYLELTAQLNDVSVNPIVAHFEDIDENILGATDWLIGSDICFWDDLVEPVTEMISRAIDSGTKRILIADPQRAPFLRVAEAILAGYGGELLEWRVKGTRSSGVILVIENA